ncbi:MAG: hypothetical protein AAGB31_13035 [Bdellovibrio sp.]
MKLFLSGLLLFTLCLSTSLATAQEDHEALRLSLSRLRDKNDLSLSFLNFQEELKNKTTQIKTDGQYYGFGLSFNRRSYRGYYAYSFGGGAAYGYAVAGSSGSAYHEKRIPWQSFFAHVGAYRRLSAYFEVGPVAMLQYKSIDWPASGSDEMEAPPNPSGGVFLEFRQRLGKEFDLFQNIGILGPSQQAAWNLGFSYNL